MLIAFACFVVTCWLACFPARQESTVQQVLQVYQSNINQLAVATDSFVFAAKTGADGKTLQALFCKARLAYKRTEWLTEYYQPYTARLINGPALAEVESEDKSVVVEPEGFQVIEELLYPGLQPGAEAELLRQAQTLRSNIGSLQTMAASLQTTDAHVFDALRLQLFRLVSLGLSGFDSPLAHNSVAEARVTIESVEQCLSIYRSSLTQVSAGFSATLNQLLAATKQYLAAHPDFDTFNRMQFTRRFANPLSESLLTAQGQLNISVFSEPRLLKPGAKNLFAEDVFNPDFYAPGAEAYASAAKRQLGERLFYDPVLSANGERSCGSCHQPGKAFSDGLKTNKALASGLALKRNTPGLLNAALQPALFYDSRVAYLEDQAKSVILNREEMHGSMDVAVQKLKRNAAYRAMFIKAYPDAEISEHAIKNALATYVRSLLALNSRFDHFMRGNNSALNATEIQGFNLFMGKAKCGTCHFAPLFNGSNPPSFTRIDAEVLGVPLTADTLHPQLDPDGGKFYAIKTALYRHAFKTPTVRNTALTAPYMHNGVFRSLEEVVAFYNRGGGKGLGLNIENQTLPEEPLNLTPSEQKAVVAFMNALTDTTSYRK